VHGLHIRRPVRQAGKQKFPELWGRRPALAAAHGISWEDVEAEAARKQDERGGFNRRIFLEYVDQIG
jgi:hypothetical protein